MFKKYRQLTIGILIGVIITLAIPINAAVEQYALYKSDIKLLINGVECQINDLPIMNFEGYNYVPVAIFRKICEEIGGKLDWVAEVKEVRITTPVIVGKPEPDIIEPQPRPAPPVPTIPIPQTDNIKDDDKVNELTFFIQNGMEILIYNNEKYITPGTISDINPEFNWQYDSSTKRLDVYVFSGRIFDETANYPSTKNTPYIESNGRKWIKYDYYKKTILPLLE